MNPLVFAQANGIPASTYNVVFRSLREKGYETASIHKLIPEPKSVPSTQIWASLQAQITRLIESEFKRTGKRVYLVGHCLGGILHLRCAFQHPDWVAGVVLLDAPILAGPRVLGWHWLQNRGLSDWLGVFAPGTIARKRQDTWSSREQALAYLRQNEWFFDWDQRVLVDYVNAATQMQDGQCVLDYAPEVETEIFVSAPHDMAQMLREKPLPCPVAHIGGRDSREQWLWGMQLTLRIARAGNTQLNGTHFFPMQYPELTAQAIDEAIRKMQLA